VLHTGLPRGHIEELVLREVLLGVYLFAKKLGVGIIMGYRQFCVPQTRLISRYGAFIWGVTDRIGWLVEDSHVVEFFEVCGNIKMCSVCITHLFATGAHGRPFSNDRVF